MRAARPLVDLFIWIVEFFYGTFSRPVAFALSCVCLFSPLIILIAWFAIGYVKAIKR